MTIIDQDTAAKWQRIQDALKGDAGRTELVRISLVTFRNAQDAYNAAYNGGPDNDGIARAGLFAWLYLRDFEYVRADLMRGAMPKDALDKLQAVSDWLERMGWHGLPRVAFVGMREIPLNRTADGVHLDMTRYRDNATRVAAA